MTGSRPTDSLVPVTLAIPENSRSQAIIDGTVKAEGIQLKVIHEFKSGSERHAGMAQGKYDASEMGSLGFMRIRAQGGNQLALPVFWLRGFRQGNVICRADSPMKALSDLKGKSIGVTAFHSSGIVWTRGMLHNDYGVTRDSVNWISAEEDEDPIPTKVKNTVLHKSRNVLWEMLDKGEIDAVIFPGNEAYYSFNPGGSLYQQMQKRGKLRTLQTDKENIALNYRKTGIYPIIHFVTIKRDLTERYPWAAKSLVEAFRAARKLASKYETVEEKEQSAEEIRFLGRDPYSYELTDGDRKAFDVLMGYMIDDGSLKERMPVESLFAPGTI